jgi:type IV pilus assembly protein PilV
VTIGNANRVRRPKGVDRARGFSLVEVMVALVVCSIGLLGLAKMEALALVNTGVAGSRSLVAIEAASLAAAMHANPAYWSAPGIATAQAQVSVGVANGPVTISDPLLAAPIATGCSTPGATSCAASAMAAYDVQQWAAALEALVPVYLATISCTTLATAPVTCTITIQWAENAVALDSKQSNLAGLQAPTYTLLVQP